MQVSSNNYNSLGKLGPHYERPEYRPPEPQTSADGQQKALEQRGDRRTLSTKNTSVPAKKAAPVMPTGRLNLGEARNLAAHTASLILALPPQSTTREPHSLAGFRLMKPVYV
ncbi:MAG: hypothetical protein LBV79_08615 [Candidatus Adiutrix sp.]|jgi:hypothetical protein|nr:hypothetical protein [Candidatus Adiutrix sp.]